MQEEHQEKIQNNNSENTIQTIEGHIENEMIITIEREQVDKNERIIGFPLVLSNELLVMSKIVDFHDEGFVVIRVQDITDAYSKEHDVFYEEICIKEGLKGKVDESPIKEAMDFASVLRQLLNYNKFISIQCEFEDNELYYSIGRISSIEADAVHFDNFDKMGVWEDDKRLIPLNKISLVGIGDYYSSIFHKYLASE